MYYLKSKMALKIIYYSATNIHYSTNWYGFSKTTKIFNHEKITTILLAGFYLVFLPTLCQQNKQLTLEELIRAERTFIASIQNSG